MPIVSKYNNEQFDALMNDLITVLEKHKDHQTEIHRCLVFLQRQAITEKFIQALTASVGHRHDAH